MTSAARGSSEEPKGMEEYLSVRFHKGEAWRRKWCTVSQVDDRWALLVQPEPKAPMDLSAEIALSGASIIEDNDTANNNNNVKGKWLGIQSGAVIIHLLFPTKSLYAKWLSNLTAVTLVEDVITTVGSLASKSRESQSASKPDGDDYEVTVTTTTATTTTTSSTNPSSTSPETTTDAMSTKDSANPDLLTITEPATRRRSTYDDHADGLEGWLHLRASAASRFSKRYARLTGGMLRIYQEPSGTEPESVISLTTAQLFDAASSLSQVKRETTFGIKVGSTVYSVRAPSAEEKTQWLSRLLKRTTITESPSSLTSNKELGASLSPTKAGEAKSFNHSEPLSGELERRATTGRWKTQWVELRIPQHKDGVAELRWYQSEEASKTGVAIGQTYLEDIQVFGPSDDGAGLDGNSSLSAIFSIVGGDKNVVTFRAATESIRSVWLARLQPYIIVQEPQMFNVSQTVSASGVAGSEQIMAGYLLKLSPNGRKWQQRWFVLTPHSLSYSKKPGASRPLGYLPIRRVRLFGASPQANVEKKDKMIGLLSGDTMYTLLAASREEKATWIAHLKKFAITTKNEKDKDRITTTGSTETDPGTTGSRGPADSAAPSASEPAAGAGMFAASLRGADSNDTDSVEDTVTTVGTVSAKPALEGYLMLRTAPGSPWHRRWFALVGQTLLCSRSDTVGEVTATFPLADAQLFAANTEAKPNGKGAVEERDLCVGVQTGDRFIELKGNSVEDIHAWMSAIARAITWARQNTSEEVGADYYKTAVLEDEDVDTVGYSPPPLDQDAATLSYGLPCGYLLKRGAHGPYWKRRWFYFDRNHLVYKKDHSITARPKGRIDVTSGRLFGPSTNADAKKRETVFGIQANNRLYVLRASNKDERQAWMSKLMAIQSPNQAPKQGLGGLSTSGVGREFAGFLMKRSPNGLRWKQRWFYVTGPEIHYAERPDSAVILGVIHLKGAQLFVASEEASSTAADLCFGVQSGERFFELRAPSYQERTRWVKFLRSVLESFQGSGTVGVAPSAKAEPTVLKEGTLRKRGTAGLWWTKRYFVLTPQRLVYKESADATDQLGSILLQDATVLEPVEAAKKKKNIFTIQVSSNGKPLTLKADNTDSYRDWTASLRSAIHNVTRPADDPSTVRAAETGRDVALSYEDVSIHEEPPRIVDADSSSSALSDEEGWSRSREQSTDIEVSREEIVSTPIPKGHKFVMPVATKPTAGANDADQAKVAQWVKYASDDIGSGKSAADLATQLGHLNKTIASQVFFVNNYFTDGDVALFKALHPVLAGADQKTREQNFHVCRWFDHIQHLQKADSGLSIIKFKRDIAQQKAGAQGGGNSAKAAKKAAKKAEKAAAKAAKKADKKANPPKPAAPAQPDVSKLDIRVGLIKKAWKHPDADSLYVEEIDVGEENPRQVVSGLVKFIPEDQMQNRPCVVLCNLKPSKMRGVESKAMVLCATSADGNTVEFVNPPEGSKPGDRITFPGQDGEPLPELPKKQKVWEKCQPDLNTNADKVACWKEIPFTTSSGVCQTATVAKGTIK